MFRKFARAALTAAFAFGTLAAGSSAQARDGYRHRGGDDDAAIAIGAGIVGLAIGAAIASDGHRHRHYDDYYYDRPYPRYRNYYRYDRYPRHYRPKHRSYRRHDRYYDDRGWRGRRYRDYRW